MGSAEDELSLPSTLLEGSLTGKSEILLGERREPARSTLTNPVTDWEKLHEPLPLKLRQLAYYALDRWNHRHRGITIDDVIKLLDLKGDRQTQVNHAKQIVFKLVKLGLFFRSPKRGKPQQYYLSTIRNKILVALTEEGIGASKSSDDLPTIHFLKEVIESLSALEQGIHKLTFDFDIPYYPLDKLTGWRSKSRGSKQSEIWLGRRRYARFEAYPTHIQFWIGCSDTPFPLTPAGIVDLIATLGEIRPYLLAEFKQQVSDSYEYQGVIPEVMDWDWTDRERQVDGKTDVRLSGKSFSIKVRYMGCLLQLYSKTTDHGTHLRLEQRERVGKSLGNELSRIFNPNQSIERSLNQIKQILGITDHSFGDAS